MEFPKLKTLHDRVVIKPSPVEDKTEGGIIIPDTAKERPVKGMVMVVGTGTKDKPMQAKPGDNVMYSKYSGSTEIEFEGEVYLVMREDEILVTY